MTRTFSHPGTPHPPKIDRSAVVEFFEERAAKSAVLGPTRAVIYQDKHPDLAENRDRAEKALLLPMMRIEGSDRVLDAGCGTGRWAEVLIPACSTYHGVDVSPGLIEIARERFGHLETAFFSVCALDDVTLETLGSVHPFTRILALGVLIYMNDDAVVESLRRMAAVAAAHARIVLREPVATQDRLTLQDHFSDDMDQRYNAVYRTERELSAMLGDTLGKAGFRLAGSGDLFADLALNNRTETRQRWFVLER